VALVVAGTSWLGRSAASWDGAEDPNTSVARLGGLVDRERTFSSEASDHRALR